MGAPPPGQGPEYRWATSISRWLVCISTRRQGGSEAASRRLPCLRAVGHSEAHTRPKDPHACCRGVSLAGSWPRVGGPRQWEGSRAAPGGNLRGIVNSRPHNPERRLPVATPSEQCPAWPPCGQGSGLRWPHHSLTLSSPAGHSAHRTGSAPQPGAAKAAGQLAPLLRLCSRSGGACHPYVQ